MEISKRLLACSKMVRKGAHLCDVGTDHAHLPCYLALQGQICHAIATDVNAKPLLRARQNITKWQMQHLIDVVQTDGLSGIQQDQADDIVIAGMGGEMIGHILQHCPWAQHPQKQYILQPMSRIPFLRRWLYQNGYHILWEQAVYESSHFYTVILCRFCGQQKDIDELFAHTGKLLKNCDPESLDYLRHQTARMQKIAQQMSQSAGHACKAQNYHAMAQTILAQISKG